MAFLVAAGASLLGSNQQAQSAAAAGQQQQQQYAEQQARINQSASNTSYAPAGAAANNAIMALLGQGGNYSNSGSSYSLFGQGSTDLGGSPPIGGMNSLSRQLTGGSFDPSVFNALMRGSFNVKDPDKVISANAPQGMNYKAFYEANPAEADAWRNDRALQAKFGGNPDAYAYWRSQQPDFKGTQVAQMAQTDNAESAQKAFKQFLASSGYQAQLQAGIDALTSSGAARGMLNSGATLKGLQKFGAGLGQQYFGNYLSQLGAVAARGVAADANVLGQSASNTANIANSIGNTSAAVSGAQGEGFSGAAQAVLGGMGYGSAPSGSVRGSGGSNANNVLGSLDRSGSTAGSTVRRS